MRKLLLHSINLKLLALCLLAVLCLQPLVPQHAAAAKDVNYVDDQAGLLTASECSQLEAQIQEVKKSRGKDVAIVTVTTRGSKTPKGYTQDYFDDRFKAGEFRKDTVVLFISMNDRWVEVHTYGKTESFIPDSRAELILDDITPLLSRGKYMSAFSAYIDDVDEYLGNHPNPLMHTPVQILIALVIGGIITAVMVSHSGGKVTTTSRTYFDNQHSGLTAKRDIYMTTTVRRIHRPQANNNISGGRSSGGFSGGGRSAGGHSHGGAGRHF